MLQDQTPENQDQAQKNQDLSEQLKKSHKELTVLYEVSNVMRSTLELDHILYIILTSVTANAGLGFNRAIIFLLNNGGRYLEPAMAIGPESGEHAQKIWKYISDSNQDLEDLAEEEKFTQNRDSSPLYNSIKHLKISLNPEEKNLLSLAFQQGNPVHILPNAIKQYQDDPLLKVFTTNELVIMPLKAKDAVKGLIVADNLYTQKAITQDDLRIFMMLANQAGLAIENSQLYEMLKHKSHTDSLTHLWNHGFFQDQLSQEIIEAKEKNLPLCLAILDIDNFKKLNDTLGHQNGDYILKEIADILKESSRDSDYICRYGGEEFAIILTQTPKDLACSSLERVRQLISEHNFGGSLYTQNPRFPAHDFHKHAQAPESGVEKITISIGLASFPADATNKEELIMKADRAMYIAKFSGKNQTCVA